MAGQGPPGTQTLDSKTCSSGTRRPESRIGDWFWSYLAIGLIKRKQEDGSFFGPCRAVADKKEDKTVTKTIHTIHTLHWGVELEMNLREGS